jgi:hypothetical protein
MPMLEPSQFVVVLMTKFCVQKSASLVDSVSPNAGVGVIVLSKPLSNIAKCSRCPTTRPNSQSEMADNADN